MHQATTEPRTRSSRGRARALAVLLPALLAAAALVLGLVLPLLGPEDDPSSGEEGAGSSGRWAPLHRDDFDTLDRGVWGVYDGPGNGQTGPRDARNTFVRDGVLVLRTAPVDGEWHGAGLSSDPGGWTQTYGRYTARVRFEPGYGVRAVALLWPASGDWPPEVDFFEVPATEVERSRGMLTNHYVDDGARDGRAFERSEVSADFTRWHVVGVEWSPGALVYTLDGEEVARTTEHVPDEPMWLGLQTGQGLVAQGIVPPAGRTAPVDLLVDWVQVDRWEGQRP